MTTYKQIAPLISGRSISKEAMRRIRRLNLRFRKHKSFGKQCRLATSKDSWEGVKVEQFEATVVIIVAITEEGYEESLLSRGFLEHLKSKEQDLRKITASVYRITPNEATSIYAIGYSEDEKGVKMRLH